MKNKILVPIMLLSLIVASPVTSVSAGEVSTPGPEGVKAPGTYAVPVTANVEETYTVTLPTSIAINDSREATYTVKVAGDVLATTTITVTPASPFDLKQGSKTVGATATLSKTSWNYSEITAGLAAGTPATGTPATGKVAAPNLTAGDWRGDLNFTITKESLPADLLSMSMEQIKDACQAGIIKSIAKVGDTFSDGTYTYTIIGINQDIPCDSDGVTLDSSTHGDVLTVMALGAPTGSQSDSVQWDGTGGTAVTMNASATPYGSIKATMNSNEYNNGSWKESDMRESVIPDYLMRLPETTRNVIGYVLKTTGQYGNSNINTADKCFILSSKEVLGSLENGPYCTEEEASANVQYQYFKNIATTRSSRTISNDWWLRSPNKDNSSGFCIVDNGSAGAASSNYSRDVFPAFCIY